MCSGLQDTQLHNGGSKYMLNVVAKALSATLHTSEFDAIMATSAHLYTMSGALSAHRGNSVNSVFPDGRRQSTKQ